MNLPKLPLLDLEETKSFTTSLSWGISDYRVLATASKDLRSVASPGFFCGDNLITWGRNLSFLEDPAFEKAWTSNCFNESDAAIVWRRYLLVCSAIQALGLPEGDFVECGVYAGTGIKTVIDYFGKDDFDRTFWGYDTYDYNPVEGHAFSGQQEGFYQKILDRFEGYSTVRLIKGLIPESFALGAPEKIAYLHIDLNNAQGEIAALEHLFDRVVPGGMVILDDYEWSGIYREQKREEDQWLQERGYRVFPLPTGQGLLIKR